MQIFKLLIQISSSITSQSCSTRLRCDDWRYHEVLCARQWTQIQDSADRLYYLANGRLNKELALLLLQPICATCVHRSSFAYLVCNKCLFEVLLPSYQVKVLILLWPWDQQDIFTRYRSLTLSVFQTILCIGLTSSLERSELHVLNNVCFVLWLFAVRFCLLRLLWLSLWTHRNPWVRRFLLHKCKATRLQAVATFTVTIIIFFYKKHNWFYYIKISNAF